MIEEAVEEALSVMQTVLPHFPLLDLGLSYEEGVWSLRLRIEYLFGVSPDQPFVSYEAQRHLRQKLRSLGFGMASKGIITYSPFRCPRCGDLETPDVDEEGQRCLRCGSEVAEEEVGEESVTGTRIFEVNRATAGNLVQELSWLLSALPKL